jgi:hypothetical protein
MQQAAPNVPMQVIAQAARVQETQLVSFMAAPVAVVAATPADTRQKNDRDAAVAAKDAAQCVP